MKLGALVPAWYARVWGLAITIMLVLALAYALGAGGIRSGGAKIDFNREKDQGQLFEIDERRAFLVGNDGYVAQVSYGRAPLPLAFCGCYEPTGNLREGYDPALSSLSAEQVAQLYPRLWTQKESCLILAMACYAVFILLIAAAPFVIRRRRGSSSGADAP